MKLLTDAQIKGKSIILRVDFNVPVDLKGNILDDSRIRAALKTIKYILKKLPKKLILITHFGRPVMRAHEKLDLIIKGNQLLTLSKVVKECAKIINYKTEIEKIQINNFPAYKISDVIYMIENIRFFDGEEKNDIDFSKKLANLGDIYVNDAFSVCHRGHASLVGIPQFLPSYAGFQLETEIENLSSLLKKPAHPLVLILGGAKIIDKILILKNLIKKVDFVLLGGVMANTFLKTRNIDIKNSVYEPERLRLAADLFDSSSKKFILPVDIVWDNDKIVDIGPSTVLQYQKIIAKAKTIFWNGTLGFTSSGREKFRKGTLSIADAVSKSSGTSIVCGGDTLGEISRAKLISKMTFVSTGGGAALKFLAGEKMPGIEALN